MTESIRDPHSDPWHPNAQLKANNPHTALRNLQARHAGTVDVLRRALTNGKLAAGEKEAASDLLDGLSLVLDETGPAHASATYLIEAAVSGVRLRRQRAEAEAAEAAA